MKTPRQRLKFFASKYLYIIEIGLLIGSVIVLFKMTSLLVIYHYLKLDYYLCIVALFFLAIGFLLRNRILKVKVSALSQPDLFVILTTKEIQVLRLLSKGYTNKEIAIAQFIEVSTVKTHVNNIYSKLSVSNRGEARSKYFEMAKNLPEL